MGKWLPGGRRWEAYLVPFRGERGRLLQPLLAGATVGNGLAAVPQSSLLLVGGRHQQVRVRLGEAARQLQVSGGARSDPGRRPGPRVLGLLMHRRVNGFWVAVCEDGGHVGTAWCRRRLLLHFGERLWFRVLLARHLDVWKPEEVFTAVEDRGGAVQEARELLGDTCSLLRARLGDVWENRKRTGNRNSQRERRLERWSGDLWLRGRDSGAKLIRNRPHGHSNRSGTVSNREGKRERSGKPKPWAGSRENRIPIAAGTRLTSLCRCLSVRSLQLISSSSSTSEARSSRLVCRNDFSPARFQQLPEGNKHAGKESHPEAETAGSSKKPQSHRLPQPGPLEGRTGSQQSDPPTGFLKPGSDQTLVDRLVLPASASSSPTLSCCLAVCRSVLRLSHQFLASNSRS